MHPLISVVVPVYNVEKYVKECIESILEQSFKNFELIIVNDGSTDNSLNRVLEFKDDRIVLINQKNIGLSGARNTGIHHAKGKYITFIDSDDWISKDYLNEMAIEAQKYNADIVSIKECKVIDGEYFYKKRPLKIFKKEAANALFGLYDSNFACGKLIRLSLLKKHNIRFPLHKHYEDMGTMYKVYSNAKVSVIADKENYFYRIRSGSITQNGTKEDAITQIEFIDEINKHQYLNKYYFFNLYILVKVFDTLSFISKSTSISNKDKAKLRKAAYAIAVRRKAPFYYFNKTAKGNYIRAILTKYELVGMVLKIKRMLN